jgi:uncharacterized RDD family membrane protein YckC
MSETMAMLEGVDPTNSIARRIVAWVVDVLLGSLVAAFAVWVVPVEFVSYNPVPGVSYYEAEGTTAAIAIFYLIPICYWIANYVVLQGLNGYTFGKVLLSLRVVRFDGRPPGPWRAFVRSIILALGLGIGGCFYAVFALAMVLYTKGHRRLGDIVAGTFVIDSVYEGRLITLTAKGAAAGPRSVYASDVIEAVPPEQRLSTEAHLRPNDPVYDKVRDTYVVWNPTKNQLLVFDKKSNTWRESN